MTLVELGVVLAIVAVLTLATAPSALRWQRDQRLKGAARDVADLLLLARAEATRTGSRYVVVFGPPGTSDPSGTPVEKGGEPAPILVFADGAPAASNCRLDAGEANEVLAAVPDVSWGVSFATARAPGDTGGAAFTPPQASGGTTADPGNNAVPWFLFGPDGIPLRFEGQLGSCGAIGTATLGGAAFYMTNGERDYAVVLSPLGGVRVHYWDPLAGAWTT